jgi:hypothetical protein
MKFMHIRETNGLSVTANGRSIHPPKTKGGITVAYELEESSNQAQVGIAFCCPRDTYSKKVGRTIARNRLKSQPLRIHMEGKLSTALLKLLVQAILIQVDPFTWAVEGEPLRATRFSSSWTSKLIAPDGAVMTLAIDGRLPRRSLYEKLKQRPLRAVDDCLIKKRHHFRKSEKSGKGGYPRGWIDRAPAWAKEYGGYE